MEKERSNAAPELSGEQNITMNIDGDGDGDGDEEHSLVIDEILDDFCEFEIKQELDGAENTEMAEDNLITIYPSEISYSQEERSRDEEGDEEEEEINLGKKTQCQNNWCIDSIHLRARQVSE